MASRIADLVQQLDGTADESMDARAELIHIGTPAIPAIPAIADGLPSLDSFGRLTAIEVFEELRDPRCGPVLIGLLADLGTEEAVEPLRRAYRACLQRATPPDWSEPSGFRWALTELGASRSASARSANEPVEPRRCQA
ncbi:hypothetical protein ACFWZ2_09115 [Streptomyces sp. NPDC059002]|uniref:hypothetical protein n=1 Tax=Streptomyces sp. NPDC059002 TaxID=3346690 RepID=UPI0036912FB3